MFTSKEKAQLIGLGITVIYSVIAFVKAKKEITRIDERTAYLKGLQHGLEIARVEHELNRPKTVN